MSLVVAKLKDEKMMEIFRSASKMPQSEAINYITRVFEPDFTIARVHELLGHYCITGIKKDGSIEFEIDTPLLDPSWYEDVDDKVKHLAYKLKDAFVLHFRYIGKKITHHDIVREILEKNNYDLDANVMGRSESNEVNTIVDSRNNDNHDQIFCIEQYKLEGVPEVGIVYAGNPADIFGLMKELENLLE